MFDLIVFGGVVFWIGVVVVSLILISHLGSDDKRCLSYLATAAFLAVNVAFVKWPITFENLLWYSLFYMGAGIAWSLFRWVLFLFKSKKEYAEIRTQYSDGQLDDEQKQRFAQYLLEHNGRKFVTRGYGSQKHVIHPPYASEFKEWLINISIFWPWSIINWVLGDFLIEIFTKIYNTLKKTYDNISKWVFSKFYEDMK